MKLADRPAAGLAGHLEECAAGDHEGCPGSRLAPVGTDGDLWRRRCACGCHLPDPWPWPCAEDHPVLVLMRNLEGSLDAALAPTGRAAIVSHPDHGHLTVEPR